MYFEIIDTLIFFFHIHWRAKYLCIFFQLNIFFCKVFWWYYSLFFANISSFPKLKTTLFDNEREHACQHSCKWHGYLPACSLPLSCNLLKAVEYSLSVLYNSKWTEASDSVLLIFKAEIQVSDILIIYYKGWIDIQRLWSIWTSLCWSEHKAFFIYDANIVFSTAKIKKKKFEGDF